MSGPRLVIVCGAPGTGKTTLARHLASVLGYVNLTKDDIKEALADEQGAGDRARSKELGRMAYDRLFEQARGLLDRGQSVVVEANFHGSQSDGGLRHLAAVSDAVVIECICDAQLRRRRFADRAERGDRHPVHLDHEILAHEWSDDASDFAIDIGCPRLVVDTWQGYLPDMRAIEAFARSDSLGDNVSTT